VNGEYNKIYQIQTNKNDFGFTAYRRLSVVGHGGGHNKNPGKAAVQTMLRMDGRLQR